MSDNERSRDRYRERDSYREPREGRERGGTPIDRRNRSRSPRRERGGGGARGGGGGDRRDTRYRSRSPFKRDERGGRVRGGDRDRGDRDRDDRARSGREPPKGPRGGPGPRRADFPPKPVRTASPPAETPDVEMKEAKQKPEDMDDDEWAMIQTMGFSGFKSTKNTKVPGNDKNYGIRRDKRMEARQYMNRQGGFNRPLSPGRG